MVLGLDVLSVALEGVSADLTEAKAGVNFFRYLNEIGAYLD